MTNNHKKYPEQLLQSLPPERVAAYIRDANHDHVLATRRYLWNIQAGNHVHSVVSILEVHLRHHIDLALRDWNTHQGFSDEWMKHPAPPLDKIISPLGGRLWHERADTTTVPKDTTPTHGDLVAGTDFGSWLYLLQHPARRQRRHWINDAKWATQSQLRDARDTIWNDILQDRVFPIHNQGAAYRYLSHCVNIRNRAAHHRPLFKLSPGEQNARFEDLSKMHDYTGRLLRGIDPDLSQWFMGIQWIPHIVSKFPQPPTAS